MHDEQVTSASHHPYVICAQQSQGLGIRLVSSVCVYHAAFSYLYILSYPERIPSILSTRGLYHSDYSRWCLQPQALCIGRRAIGTALYTIYTRGRHTQETIEIWRFGYRQAGEDC